VSVSLGFDSGVVTVSGSVFRRADLVWFCFVLGRLQLDLVLFPVWCCYYFSGGFMILLTLIFFLEEICVEYI
jgi:hypothetical protein